MGHIGRFRYNEAPALRRADRVVCRTVRGVEMGVILGPAALESSVGCAQPGDELLDLADGRILRKVSAEDELLWGHLQQLGYEAQISCQRWLDERQIPATLVDVEPLMDGRTLYFHFLSEVDASVQAHLDELVELYEAEVRKCKFAQLLEHGCGPGCGTSQAKHGCGSKGGCAVCKIASQCKA
ncbi:MAG: hypothetical protein R3C53_16985 [Pirellulaceae bacterium]